MSQVAERYALALHEVVQKKNSVADTAEALEALAEAIKNHDDIKGALSSPLIDTNNKIAILTSAMGSDLSGELKTLFELMAKNNRLSMVPQVAESFREVVAKDTGVLSGEVCSASELSDSEKTNIQKSIEDKLGRKVELTYKVDPNMIGGIEAKVGSYIFEDSIKSHMQKLNDFITRRVQ